MALKSKAEKWTVIVATLQSPWSCATQSRGSSRRLSPLPQLTDVKSDPGARSLINLAGTSIVMKQGGRDFPVAVCFFSILSQDITYKSMCKSLPTLDTLQKIVSWWIYMYIVYIYMGYMCVYIYILIYSKRLKDQQLPIQSVELSSSAIPGWGRDCHLMSLVIIPKPRILQSIAHVCIYILSNA